MNNPRFVNKNWRIRPRSRSRLAEHFGGIPPDRGSRAGTGIPTHKSNTLINRNVVHYCIIPDNPALCIMQNVFRWFGCKKRSPPTLKLRRAKVELEGVEPSSKQETKVLSTCLADCWFSRTTWQKAAELILILNYFAATARHAATSLYSQHLWAVNRKTWFPRDVPFQYLVPENA